MRFSAAPVFTTMALAFAGLARADCKVALESTTTTPSSSGALVSAAVLRYFQSSTGLSSVSSDCCDWADSAAAPFSVTFYDGVETGFDTDAELEAVLDDWIGTYLRSETTTAESSDYLVTGVTCA